MKNIKSFDSFNEELDLKSLNPFRTKTDEEKLEKWWNTKMTGADGYHTEFTNKTYVEHMVSKGAKELTQEKKTEIEDKAREDKYRGQIGYKRQQPSEWYYMRYNATTVGAPCL